jgi:deoxyribodipyrimidine photo-lyase
MEKERTPCLLWFRQDLRLADNPALTAAAERGAPIIAAYVLDDAAGGDWAIGGAARWWLHHSLAALAESLKALGVPLVLRRGAAAAVIPALAEEIGAGAVFWNRLYEPLAVAGDAAIAETLRKAGREVRGFAASLIAEPQTAKTKTGTPFKVFTPFWNNLRGQDGPGRPQRPPKIHQETPRVASDDLADWRLLPKHPDWAKGFSDDWTPGEAGARARLRAFIENGLSAYATGRNLPGIEGVSRLSPHLHWGELSIRQVWHAAELHAAEPHAGDGAEPYLRELGWRDFAHHLLWQFPDLPATPFIEGFAAFPWRTDPAGLKAWQRGRTGYPFVDAGMRQLWAIGWMHNRVRMVVGSFLVKHLLIDWREGEKWFWDCLVDADLANNAFNWQWIAGSGADAAPYFRIFNPVLQGEKFDGTGDYVRRWVPEIAALPDAWLHKPWLAPAEVLAKAGIELGKTYPAPIVDHDAARARALAALKSIRA